MVALAAFRNLAIFRTYFFHLSAIIWECDGELNKIGGRRMSLFAHIEELTEKHQSLHRQIEEEMAHPLVDSLKVSELKRKKLRLKEKIEKLKSERHVA